MLENFKKMVTHGQTSTNLLLSHVKYFSSWNPLIVLNSTFTHFNGNNLSSVQEVVTLLHLQYFYQNIKKAKICVARNTVDLSEFHINTTLITCLTYQMISAQKRQDNLTFKCILPSIFDYFSVRNSYIRC